ncbi:hypothetical protein ACFL3F_01320 [Planctomycetota bacterium]
MQTSDTSTDAPPEKTIWEELVGILDAAQQAIRQSQIARMIDLVDQARPLADRLRTADLSSDQVAHLEQAYRQLELMATAHKQEVSEQLKHLRSGRQGLDVYRRNQ